MLSRRLSATTLPLLLDGALATELERRGAVLNDALWSAKVLMEQPGLIREVHLDYLKAGAGIITTAAYQATAAGFMKKGLSRSEAEALLQLSTALAEEAVAQFAQTSGEERALVAVSVGPYGAYLANGAEYHGQYGLSVAALKDFHAERLEVLGRAGGDFLLFETVPCLAEVNAIVEVLAAHPAWEAVLSLTCKNETLLRSDEKIREALEMVNAAPGVVMAAFNCTQPRHLSGLIRLARQYTGKPIMVYPNSGEAWNARKKNWSGDGGGFPGLATEWYRMGAAVIGGCCRTTPEDIRQLYRLRQQWWQEG